MQRITRTPPRTLPRAFSALVEMLPPSAIHDEVAYRNNQEMIDALTSLPKLSEGQSRYLDTLSVLAEAYEDERHEIDVSEVSALDVLKTLMEAHAMNASDLGRLLGDRSIGSKVLSGSRELSKAHIRTLATHFRVKADVFL